MLLNNDNFELYAAHFYDIDRAVSTSEFVEDIKRFQYIKRLFKRYSDGKELKSRLILNHLIILYNCFGINTTEMLFFRLPEYHHLLKPFIVYLSFMPDTIQYNDTIIKSSDISMEQSIIDELRKI